MKFTQLNVPRNVFVLMYVHVWECSGDVQAWYVLVNIKQWLDFMFKFIFNEHLLVSSLFYFVSAYSLWECLLTELVHVGCDCDVQQVCFTWDNAIISKWRDFLWTFTFCCFSVLCLLSKSIICSRKLTLFPLSGVFLQLKLQVCMGATPFHISWKYKPDFHIQKVNIHQTVKMLRMLWPRAINHSAYQLRSMSKSYFYSSKDENIFLGSI